MERELALTLLLVFSAAVAVGYGLVRYWRQQRRRRSMVRSLRRESEADADAYRAAWQKEDPWIARWGQKLSKGLPHDPRLRLKLIRAGWDSRTAPLTFSVVRLWLLLGFALAAGVAVYTLNRNPTEAALATGGGIVVGWLALEIALRRRIRLRKRAIQRSLPDALDLMVVCVEAGVGLDAAILRVADEFKAAHPEISREFRNVNQSVNAGISRVEALRDMVRRTTVDEIRSLVTTLVQSEKLGVPIARVLRVSAEGLRTKRRQAAERAARKAPIKMLVPLILFILPALIMVILGPAAMHLVRVMRTAVG